MYLNRIDPSSKSSPQRTPLLILDIDGTVRQSKDDPLGRFVNGPDDVIVFPEVPLLMQEWKKRRGRIIGISNQGGIATGHVSESDSRAAMMRTFLLCGSLFDQITCCPHHPDATDPQMRQCWCRKPRPGLVIETAYELSRLYNEVYPIEVALFVGDREEDRECARILGIKFKWASSWRKGICE